MRGFTMIELVTVIVVLGILAVVALPRMDTGSYAALDFHDRSVATLRYAQKTATSHRRLVCVSFTATTLSLNIASLNTAATATCDTSLLLPGLNSNTMQSRDAANAAYASVPGSFSFNPDGSASANQTISFAGTSPPTAISVAGTTGYVQ